MNQHAASQDVDNDKTKENEVEVEDITHENQMHSPKAKKKQTQIIDIE